jgi:hypothetical protein
MKNMPLVDLADILALVFYLVMQEPILLVLVRHFNFNHFTFKTYQHDTI